MGISWKYSFPDQSLAWSRTKKHNGIQKAQETMLWMYSGWAKWCFPKKKEPPIFIYKGMTLTLKLLPLSSDSTKMPFLPAIRPPAPVIRLWVVTPHARLHVEP